MGSFLKHSKLVLLEVSLLYIVAIVQIHYIHDMERTHLCAPVPISVFNRVAPGDNSTTPSMINATTSQAEYPSSSFLESFRSLADPSSLLESFRSHCINTIP